MLALERQGPEALDLETIGALIGALGLAAMAALGAFGPPKFGPPCLMKSATGLPCPACGGTRGVAALARLHLWESFTLNPLVFIGAFIFGAWWVYAVYAAIARPERRLRLKFPPTRAGRAMRFALMASVAVNWFYLVWAGR